MPNERYHSVQTRGRAASHLVAKAHRAAFDCGRIKCQEIASGVYKQAPAQPLAAGGLKGARG